MLIKHQKFADFLLTGMNGKEAAIAAGYSEGCAAERACKLRKRPDVAAYIEHEQKRMQAVARMDRDEAVQTLERDIRAAKTAGQHNAAQQYRRDQLKILGHLNDQPAAVNVNVFDGLSRPEREARLLSDLSDLGLSLPPPDDAAPVINGHAVEVTDA